MKKYFAGIAGFIVLFGFDQWTKYLACRSLQGQEAKSVLGDVFVLQYLENRGAAFGMFQKQRVFLVVLTIVILAALIIAFIKIPSIPKFHILRVLAVMLAAGAVGNMWDRIFRGYVVDFLYFKLINFPIFNVADCYVVVSAILAALLIGFYYKEEDFKTTEQNPENSR